MSGSLYIPPRDVVEFAEAASYVVGVNRSPLRVAVDTWTVCCLEFRIAMDGIGPSREGGSSVIGQGMCVPSKHVSILILVLDHISS